MLMAVPNKEVIDLTGDADNGSAPPRPRPRPQPQPSRALTDRRPRVNGSRVGGHAPGPVHTHPHPTSNNTFEPAAKRQRLSGDPPPKTYKTTWNAQHVAAHTEAALWPHAKAAADFIRDTEVDKGKLRSEVGNNYFSRKRGSMFLIGFLSSLGSKCSSHSVRRSDQRDVCGTHLKVAALGTRYSG